MTKRKEDINGWIEVKDNPISKVGVFEYSGAQIGASEPDRIYKVYRSAEELSKPESLDSFKLLPFIDDHEMLGSKVGGTPAEDRNFDGVIGENVYFEDPYVKANIKIFSESLQGKIDDGKIELSCGYQCEYDFTSGTFEGEHYDAIQRHIRGNHLALVDEGRMGKDVAVLDHLTFTVDAKEKTKMEKEEMLAKLAALMKSVEEGKELSSDEQAIVDSLNGTSDDDDAAKTSDNDEPTGDEGEETKAADEGDEPKATDGDEPTGDEDDPTLDDDETASDEEEEKAIDEVVNAAVGDDDTAKASGMDAALRKALKTGGFKLVKEKRKATGMDARSVMAEISKRDKLASRLSNVVGTFDHSAMTTQDVANYGAKKLGLKAKGRAAIIALDSYLIGAKRNASKATVAQDSRVRSSTISNYINQGK